MEYLYFHIANHGISWYHISNLNTVIVEGGRDMRVHITDLVEGDYLEQDTFNSFGLHILSADRRLDESDIAKLFQHQIEYVEIAIRVQASSHTNVNNKRTPNNNIKIQGTYNFAVDGVKQLFEQALHSGKIDEEQVSEGFAPLVENFKSEKDVVSLLLTLNNKDDYTYQHSVQVGILAYFLAKWLGTSEAGALLAGKAGYLHDIGKCKIETDILNKPSRLNDKEFAEIKKHTIFGYEILNQSFNNSALSFAAIEHHERCDGTGYPKGIKASTIQPLSKIIAVADIYSAMISTRVYQKERDLLHVLQELHRISFNELDPKYTQMFIKHMIPNFIGKSVLLSNGDIGTIVFTNQSDLFRPLVKVNEEFIDLSNKHEISIEKIYM